MIVNQIPITWRPDLSIYASEPFLRSVGDEYGWLGGFEGDRLRCILPFTIVRKAILRMVRFRVETIAVDGELSVADEKEFLNSAMTYFRRKGADLIIPASNNTLFRTYPDGATAAPYGSYVVKLTQSEEELWANLHAKHRNVIRNASKNGVTIACGLQHLDAACQVVRETLRRSALGFPGESQIRTYARVCPDNIRVFVAQHQEQIQGAAIIPFSRYGAYYLYGGSATRPVSGAMNLLTWEAMRHFRAIGVERYDFVGARVSPEAGSKQEGLKKFKERFGGAFEQGFMWKHPLCRWKFKMYNLGARLRSGGDVVDEESSRASLRGGDLVTQTT